MNCSTQGFPVLHHLPELAQTQVHWVSDAIQPPHPLSPTSPPAFNLSQHQGLFQPISSLHQVAKDWDFSFSISPSNEHSGLISFRIDLFDLLASQRTLKSLLQHHNSKASILRHSAFFMVQISHPDMTIGKTIPLTIQTFVRKGKSQNSNRFYFLGLQNHSELPEIKRYLLLGRKTITNLDSILKSRDIIFSIKVHIVKAMVFPIVMYKCLIWTVKKTECQSWHCK